MSQLVNLADDVYAHLTSLKGKGLKRRKKASYSEIVRNMYSVPQGPRTMSLRDLIDDIRSRHRGLKPRTKPIDHDLIAYGVSRARS